MRHIDEILVHMGHGMIPEIYHGTRFESSVAQDQEQDSNLGLEVQEEFDEADLDIHSMEFLRRT